MSSEAWDAKARLKRESLQALIPPEWRLIDAPSPHDCPNVMTWPRNVMRQDEITITESSPVVILAKIHTSVWTAEEVTRAFCHRAAIAHQLVNCCTEFCFDRAIRDAVALDGFKKETGGLKGPLHGLPMSFMDRYRIEGLETSAGYISCLGKHETAASESPMVILMRQMGAVPICKTNIPQSMLLGGTENNIWGCTTNPYNRQLSAGGAAGGEGALLAMRGSPFGWATEIAGSARIPAVFNGLYALRSSCGRLASRGMASASRTLPLCRPTAAMISSDLSILVHVCRLIFGAQQHRNDPEWLDMPWRESKIQQLNLQRPAFAILQQDRFIRPQPPVLRALEMVATSLQRSGYEVVKWEPPLHAVAAQTLFKIIGADGAAEVRTQIKLSGEPPVPQLKDWYQNAVATASLSTKDFWTLCNSRLEYIAAYNAYWQSTAALTSTGQPVTGVILPVVANAACVENKLSYFGYCAIANYLDFSAACFPVTSVDSKQDKGDPDSTPLSAQDRLMQLSYDAELFNGSPVGLQVMCRRLEEETALGLAEIITRACPPQIT